MAAQREPAYYLIDGYNVINAWPELIRLRSNLDEARDVLIRILTEYGAFENYEMTVVFDAFATDEEEHTLEISSRMRVIYTATGETADSCIERLAYTAVRITSPELRRSVKKAKKLMRAEYISTHTKPLGRIEVHERIDRATLARLEELRRKK